jgi:hypothetical protein
MPVTVKVITDGPLMVQGECVMQDGQGNAIPGKGGDSIFLCRCGSSANKLIPARAAPRSRKRRRPPAR